MPIYEFYCPGCHRIFSFLSRRVDTAKKPPCPRCGKLGLQRRISPFAVSVGRSGSATEDGLPDLDETRMERAVEALTREAAGIDENDPRSMGRLMRRLHDETGLPLGEGFEEAIRRMEAGEDPDQIEQELGHILEAEPPLPADVRGPRAGRRRPGPASRDPELYEL